MASAKDETLTTVAPKAAVTSERWVDTYNLNIPKPHVPRALVAPDSNQPYGSPGHENKGFSVLQQHVEFFDRNKDGLIYPWETYEGFRAIGFNIIISFLAAFIINIAFSYLSLDSWIPDPFFPIKIKNIHRDKHGSDTEIYDTEGRFLPSKFEELFTKFAKTRPDALTFKELFSMTQANRNAYDLFGGIAAKLEWLITYWLLSKDGFVPKEAIRGVYDASIFYDIEKNRRKAGLK